MSSFPFPPSGPADPSGSAHAGSGAPPRLPGLTLLRLLGQGASGHVYAARRDLDGWRCAVKVVAGDEPRSLARLRREVAVLTNVRLPHLIRLHEVIEVPPHRLALVLDLVDGGSVATILDQRGHLPAGEVVTILAPILATLAALHQRGVVHGDVSAGNVLVALDGRPQLTDLGAARLIGETHPDVLATTGFVAPELVEGAQPSAATDVYGAGALGWLMLTGTPAGHGALRPSLADLVPAAPTELTSLIEECLAGDPSRRPDAATAAERVCAAATPLPVDVAGHGQVADRLTRRLHGARHADPDDVVLAIRAPGVSGDRVVERPGAGPGWAPRRSAVWPSHEVAQLRGVPDPGSPGGRHRGGQPTRTGRFVLLAGCGAVAMGVVGIPTSRGWTGRSADGDVAPGVNVAASGLQPATAAPVGTVGSAPSVTGKQTTAAAPEATAGSLAAQSRRADGGGLGASPSASADGGAGPMIVGAGMPPTVAASGATSPLTALEAVVSARVEAYERSDPELLKRVYLPDSAALRLDRARLQALRARGARFEGLRYRIRPASPTAAEHPSSDPSRRTVRVHLDTLPYTMVFTDGQRVARSGISGRPTQITLIGTPQGWRIESLVDA